MSIHSTSVCFIVYKHINHCFIAFFNCVCNAVLLLMSWLKKTASLSASRATVFVNPLSVWECVFFTEVNVTWNYCSRGTEHCVARIVMFKETMIREQNFDDLALAFQWHLHLLSVLQQFWSCETGTVHSELLSLNQILLLRPSALLPHISFL